MRQYTRDDGGTRGAVCVERLEPRRLLAVDVGTGLQGTYFDNPDFTGPSVTRLDKKVYFDFNAAPPPSPIAPTLYSVRWTGKVKPSYGEAYTFHLNSDDGVRLWVNHRIVIDDWNARSAPIERSGTIKLDASKRVDIQLEYLNKKGTAVVQLWWSSPSQVKQVVPTARLYPEAQDLHDKIDHAFSFAEQQIARTLQQVGPAPSPAAYPTHTVGSGAPGTDGTWTTTPPESWTSGFLAGTMWQAYYHNPKKAMRLNATAWTQSLAGQANLPDDMGFRTYVPWVNLSIPQTSTVMLAAADAKLAQWNDTVGMFRSTGGTTHSTDPSGDFAVIIDQAMDMQLLFWAWKQTGNVIYRDRAMAHLTKLAQHYVRADGSTAQWGYFNSTTGAFVGHDKKQGYSATSAWSRGQAWAIYAYTHAYRMTGNATFLNVAKKVSDYFIQHAPADGVPYWDFLAPSPVYRDTSAAAIAASGFLDLARQVTDPALKAKYHGAGEKILNSLIGPAYLAEGSTSLGVLLHGAAFVPRKATLPDNSLVYGDHYFLEAMNRYVGTL